MSICYSDLITTALSTVIILEVQERKTFEFFMLSSALTEDKWVESRKNVLTGLFGRERVQRNITPHARVDWSTGTRAHAVPLEESARGLVQWLLKYEWTLHLRRGSFNERAYISYRGRFHGTVVITRKWWLHKVPAEGSGLQIVFENCTSGIFPSTSY